MAEVIGFIIVAMIVLLIAAVVVSGLGLVAMAVVSSLLALARGMKILK